METQRYGRNPTTGRVEHYYVSLGRAEVARLRGTAITPRTAKNGMGNRGRKITGRGAA